MPGLSASLQGHDLGQLIVVGQQWGLELHPHDAQHAIELLEANLPAAVAAGFSSLAAEIQGATRELAAIDRLPWGQFERKYGPLREMGPARREKDQPHQNPASVTETLWYRGLVGRAFFDTPDGPREFVYIPDELLAVIPRETEATRPFGRAARPEERAVEQLASDAILDQACSLLAGMRKEAEETKLADAEPWLLPREGLKSLLIGAGVLDERGEPDSKAIRKFLESPRGTALAWLVQAWLDSDEFNELRLLPGLRAEGNWENEPLAARRRLLEFVRSAPKGQWWSLKALIADVKARQPDFQRPAGDYDSWYLRHEASGEYLRGFQHWDDIDGTLISFFVRGPLYALGLIDLASPATEQPATAFRWSRLGGALLNGDTPKLRNETSKLKIDSRGRVLISELAPRAVRYFVARFCDWLPKQKDGYLYQISARSLEAARKQGLKVKQLVALLKANSAAALSPNLLQALKRWETQGTQARLGRALVLWVGSAAALKALRASHAARFLDEPLGPTAIVVKPNAGQQVMQALLELGYLGDLEETEL